MTQHGAGDPPPLDQQGSGASRLQRFRTRIHKACCGRLLWLLGTQCGNGCSNLGLMPTVFHSGLPLRPSYCAGSYGPVRIKASTLQPVDARGKARRLQSISLRFRKSPQCAQVEEDTATIRACFYTSPELQLSLLSINTDFSLKNRLI